MAAFAAYLLPGVEPASISDSISAVSALRFVLRKYTGAELPPIEDASYWPGEGELDSLVRVVP